MTDDLSMQALSGPLSARAKAALFAGCDVVLHCNGGMDEMKDVATEAKPLEGEWLKRAETALGHLRAPVEFDRIAAEARLKELLVA
jgi:Beta-glucosidase-related glycosidases